MSTSRSRSARPVIRITCPGCGLTQPVSMDCAECRRSFTLEEVNAARSGTGGADAEAPPAPPPASSQSQTAGPSEPATPAAPDDDPADSPYAPTDPAVSSSDAPPGEPAVGDVSEEEGEFGDVYDPETAVHSRTSVRSGDMLPVELAPGDVVREAVDVCRENFVPVLILMVIVSIPSWLYSLSLANPATPAPGAETSLLGPLLRLFGYGLVVLLTQLLGSAVLTHVVGAWLRDKTLVLYDIIALSLRALFPLILLSLIQTVLTGLGYLLLIIPGVILSIAWSVAVPAAVEERLKPWEALSRSWDLTSGNWFQIFIAFLILRTIQVVLQVGRWIFLPGDLLVVDLAFELAVTSLSASLVALIYFKLRSYRERVPVESLPSVHEAV